MLYTTQQLQGEGSLVSSPEHLAGVALVQPPRNRKGVNVLESVYLIRFIRDNSTKLQELEYSTILLMHINTILRYSLQP